jgi:hypothetical protein
MSKTWHLQEPESLKAPSLVARTSSLKRESVSPR